MAVEAPGPNESLTNQLLRELISLLGGSGTGGSGGCNCSDEFSTVSDPIKDIRSQLSKYDGEGVLLETSYNQTQREIEAVQILTAKSELGFTKLIGAKINNVRSSLLAHSNAGGIDAALVAWKAGLPEAPAGKEYQILQYVYINSTSSLVVYTTT